MFNILTLNKIAKCGLDQLNDNYKITDDANVTQTVSFLEVLKCTIWNCLNH